MPTATISGTTGVCFGQSSAVTFTGTAGAVVTYTVNGGANQTITLNASGNASVSHSGVTATYTLVSVSLNGCSQNATGTATITIGSDIQVSLSGDCVNNVFVLSASPVNGSFNQATANYSFDPSTLGVVGSKPWEFKPSSTGVYSVSVNVGGCIGVATFNVENISCSIQKGISPNGDSKNDSFDLRGMNVSHLTIYNRYGKQVYTRFNYTNEWSGQTSEGDSLPDGTYYYMIERTNGESLTGWVYINRSN
jgi:gliding motility-associated-like protein